MKRIYMDNGSTTRTDPRVLEAMRPYFSELYGNASSTHALGSSSAEALEKAREQVARTLNCSPEEVFFTSGGTESDNIAVKGIAYGKKKGHIITSAIEHPAVLNSCNYLEKNGFSVTYVPVDSDGIVKVDEVRKAVKEDTILISIMHANNEVGTIQPISEIAEISMKKDIPFHTDAVQSIGKIKTDVNYPRVNMLSISAHKFHGPKGIGALYIQKGTPISPLFHGGGHERNIRSGTENIPGIVGMAEALKIASDEMEENKRVEKLRDRLINGILEIKQTSLNGPREKRLSNNVNISFKFIEGEGLVLKLDSHGICASTASACSSHSLKPSHVLLALGLNAEDAHGSLRLTLSKFNDKSDVDKVLEVLPEEVGSLRSISPFSTEEEINEFKEKHATEEDEYVL